MEFREYLDRRNVRRTRFMSHSRLTVLLNLSSFIAEHGYGPSVRELTERLQRRSHSSVHTHLDCLCRDGFISRSPGRARSWALTLKAKSLLPLDVRAA